MELTGSTGEPIDQSFEDSIFREQMRALERANNEKGGLSKKEHVDLANKVRRTHEGQRKKAKSKERKIQIDLYRRLRTSDTWELFSNPPAVVAGRRLARLGNLDPLGQYEYLLVVNGHGKPTKIK